MGKEVTIPLKDLRTLVKLLFLYSVDNRAQRLVRKKQPEEKAPIVKQYLLAVAEMMPAARKRQRARYGELLASLRSGQDVPLVLATFLAREAKTSADAETKARPLL